MKKIIGSRSIRGMFTREFYIPKNYSQILSDDDLGALVMADQAGCCVMAFSAKRQKYDFYIKFGTKEKAEKYVSEWYADLKKRALEKINKRQALKHQPNPLQVGDILKSSWGYDQTNINYYEVIELIGKRTVEIRAIAKDRQVTGYEQGTCVPLPGKYIDQPMRRRVGEWGHVCIERGMYARKVEYSEMEGKRIYDCSDWTSYA